MFLFAVARETVDGPDVDLAILLEPAIYPTKNAMNIVIVAGKNLGHYYNKYWKFLCGWAYLNGAKEFEAYVSPAMERILKRYDFERTCVHVRMPITSS
jgi:hypothetical protein